MFDFNILQLIYMLSLFVVLFFCMSKIILNNFSTSLCKCSFANDISDDYIKTHDMTVDDYEVYNRFMIWLYVVEY